MWYWVASHTLISVRRFSDLCSLALILFLHDPGTCYWVASHTLISVRRFSDLCSLALILFLHDPGTCYWVASHTLISVRGFSDLFVLFWTVQSNCLFGLCVWSILCAVGIIAFFSDDDATVLTVWFCRCWFGEEKKNSCGLSVLFIYVTCCFTYMACMFNQLFVGFIHCPFIIVGIISIVVICVIYFLTVYVVLLV